MQISRFTSSKPSKFAFASDEKSIRRPTTSFVRLCLRRFPALPPRMRREARYCLKPRKGDCLRLTVRSGGSPPFSLSRVPRPVSARRAQRPRAVTSARVPRPASARRELRLYAVNRDRVSRLVPGHHDYAPRTAFTSYVPRLRVVPTRPTPASRDLRLRAANCVRELCSVFVRCTMYPRVVNRELCDAL